MTRGRYILSVCSGLLLCGALSAEVVVREYAGYVLGTDYEVTPSSRILILQPSLPGVPYDFDCYDEATGEPAVVRALTATAGIGTVEVTVRPHEGRPYGAGDLGLLQIDQEGVTGRIVELNIGRDLGADGPTRADSAGRLGVGRNVVNPIEIAGDVSGALTVEGSVLAVPGDPVIEVDIGGDVIGPLTIRRTLGGDIRCAALRDVAFIGTLAGSLGTTGDVVDLVAGGISGDLAVGAT